MNGYPVDPRDIEATADRVTPLLEDEQLRDRFGEQGRETVRERFLTPRLVDDYYLAQISEATTDARTA